MASKLDGATFDDLKRTGFLQMSELDKGRMTLVNSRGGQRHVIVQRGPVAPELNKPVQPTVQDPFLSLANQFLGGQVQLQYHWGDWKIPVDQSKLKQLLQQWKGEEEWRPYKPHLERLRLRVKNHEFYPRKYPGLAHQNYT